MRGHRDESFAAPVFVVRTPTPKVLLCSPVENSPLHQPNPVTWLLSLGPETALRWSLTEFDFFLSSDGGTKPTKSTQRPTSCV